MHNSYLFLWCVCVCEGGGWVWGVDGWVLVHAWGLGYCYTHISLESFYFMQLSARVYSALLSFGGI